MLRQKIDWEKVPWLMTKVKVSEEYYVNYWRHTPFQREWEGEQAGGARRGRRREREWGTGREKRTAESMSPKNGSPNTHFLPSFISSDKLTSHTLLVAGCNKGGGGGGGTVNISMILVKERFRGKQCLKWNHQGGKFQLKGKGGGWRLDVSLWSMSQEVEAEDGPLSFLKLEMGSERTCVLA